MSWLLRSQDVPSSPTGSEGREEKRDHSARPRFPSLNKCRQRSFFEDTVTEVQSIQGVARVDLLDGHVTPCLPSPPQPHPPSVGCSGQQKVGGVSLGGRTGSANDAALSC